MSASNEVVSSFFSENASCTSIEPNKEPCDISNDFLHLIDELNVSLEQFQIPALVRYVYNPTVYAKKPFEMYVNKYCNTKKHIMYFGMNPGPFGMSQTGVPFGEVSSVRDWLGIEGPVGKPPEEAKSRPVKGFDCPRTEVSGKRFWGIFKDLCKTPENFFKTSFVYNYLNQQWIKSNGANVTVTEFKVSEMKPLYDICDQVFIKVLQLYEVKTVVAIGKFCEERAQKALSKYLPTNSLRVLYLPHPSPRAVNNNDWDKKAVKILEQLDLLKYYTDMNS